MTGDGKRDEVRDAEIIIHRPECVDLCRSGQNINGGQEGGLHGQGDRNPVHLTTAREELLRGHVLPTAVADDYAENRREHEKQREDEIVRPVESQIIVCHSSG